MLLPKEIWKDIEGYEGKYQVSDKGHIRSLNYNQQGKVKRLKIYTNEKGYKQVSLYKEGKCKLCNVHRLVAEAFIPNPNNYPIINHKDENPSNNVVDNLEWCSYKYNTNYGSCIERISKANKGKKHKPFSEQTRKKMSESGKCKTFTDEHRKNISKAKKEYWRKRKGE